ncbi:MAG: class II fructose-bisphosphate aldolase [Candidatus Vogelbacteria bacterium]|nr:class II fructose-bisphosphate aldolase [Candidatus Vogelbacteria bacterium]
MKTYREYLADASRDRYALGHFNISTIETLWAIFDAAREARQAVIIGVSEGERDFIGMRQAVALVKSIRDEFNYPIFINADHTYSVKRVKEAIDVGFDSAIFDGARLPIDENIALTKECVAYSRASKRDVVIEGELGYIGTSSNVLDVLPEGVAVTREQMTAPEDAERFVRETDVDLFAPAVGNIHGMLKNTPNPRLDIELVKNIAGAVDKPLVLHGGSGILDDDFRAATQAGISVIHINTELRVAWRGSIEESLKSSNDVAPYKLLVGGRDAMRKVVADRLSLFCGK